MAELKEMYKKIVKDNFADTIKVDMGGQVLLYKKKVLSWANTETWWRTSPAIIHDEGVI